MNTKQTKHTPGPWVFRKYAHDEETRKRMQEVGIRRDMRALSNDGEAAIVSESGRIASVDCHAEFKRGKGHESVCEQRDANAALIAAAPELLEFVKGIDEIIRSGKSSDVLWNYCAGRSGEVLAKAEGQ